MDTAASNLHLRELRGPTVLFIAGAIALLPRIALIAAGPHFEGDAHTYALVAENIQSNLCVSMSDPSSADCVPHWGGNQLPGYPAFIAAVWAIVGQSLTAPLLAQSLVSAIAIVYLVRVVQVVYGTGPAWMTLLVLSLSPSLIGWSRALFTETLTIAASLWVLAELLRSYHESRLRVWPLAAVLAAGLFVRYDFLIVAVPVGIFAFVIHSPKAAILRLLLIALIITIPYGAWTARSSAQGLELIPPFGITPSGGVVPSGLLSWVGTWLERENQLGHTVWAIVNRDYLEFRPSPDAFEFDPARAKLLLSKLRRVQGEAVPALLDAEFAQLALDRRSDHPLRQYVALPARRAANMWGSPYPGLGWPSGLSGRERNAIVEILATQGIGGVLTVFGRYPQAMLTKLLITGYRYVVICLFAVLTIYAVRRGDRALRVLVGLVGLYAILRTIIFSQTVLVETRYLAAVMAWVEVAVAIGSVVFWSKVAKRVPTASRSLVSGIEGG